MSKKHNILILLTPFHLRQYKKLVEEYGLPDSSLVIFHSNLVSETDILQNIGKLNYLYSIPEGNISFNNFIKYSTQTYIYLKRLFKKYEYLIESVNKLIDNKIDIYIGSDKDLFTQILVHKLESKIKNVHAFEEGTSYYIDETFFDVIKRCLFFLFSKAIWGYRFRYVRAMGRSSWINIIYARLPEQISNNKAKVYPISNNKLITPLKKKGKILFITSPFSEYSLMKFKDEVYVYSTIINYLKDNFEIIIKQHPKESDSKINHFILESKNVTVLPKMDIAEKINYFDFERVINFGSSVVIDILLAQYPPQDIITFHITRKMKLPNFYNKTKIVDLTDMKATVEFPHKIFS